MRRKQCTDSICIFFLKYQDLLVQSLDCRYESSLSVHVVTDMDLCYLFSRTVHFLIHLKACKWWCFSEVLPTGFSSLGLVKHSDETILTDS